MGKLKRCTGKRLDYLGMIIDYSQEGVVSFQMNEYTEKMIKDFEEAESKLKETKTPAADHLFLVREEAPSLSEKKALLFHNMTAKALYL